MHMSVIEWHWNMKWDGVLKKYTKQDRRNFHKDLAMSNDSEIGKSYKMNAHINIFQQYISMVISVAAQMVNSFL